MAGHGTQTIIINLLKKLNNMSAISNISKSYFSENNIRYVFIDGKACKQIDDCYATLQQQLSLPDYFGNNLDALEEVLSDLDWIKEEKIRIIILNQSELLVNESNKKESFLEILNSCDNDKLEIIYLRADNNKN
jgi:RNAse (barnase) inhibitor barstar